MNYAFSPYYPAVLTAARYVLVTPSLFIFLSRLGRSAAFDHAWTTGGILLLSMQAALFTFDMWVA